MGKLTTIVEIEASPEKVFAFILDHKKMNEIYPKGGPIGERTSKGPVGVGSTSHWVSPMMGGNKMEFDMVCTEFVENKKMVSKTMGGSKFNMTGSYDLEPIAKGTKLTQTMDYEVPYSILGKLIDKLKFGKELKKGSVEAMENMKKALEA